MRKILEMYKFSRMQHMVQIGFKKHLFRDQFILLKFSKQFFGGSRRWEPHGEGIIKIYIIM